MKCLIVGDDTISSQVLGKMLSRYGSFDIVVDDKQSIDLFLQAFENNSSYDLIIMDITKPELNRYYTVRIIREKEEIMHIPLTHRVKVIKTIALENIRTVVTALHGSYADSYLIKPISVSMLVSELRRLNLICEAD